VPIPARFTGFFSWGTSALVHVAVGGAFVGFGGSSVFWYSGSSSPRGNAYSAPARLAGASVTSEEPPVLTNIVRAIAIPFPKRPESETPEASTDIAPQSTDIERQSFETTIPLSVFDVGRLVEQVVTAEETDVIVSRKASPADEPEIDHDEEPAASPKQGTRELAPPALGDHGIGPDDIDSMPSIAGADEPPSPFPSNPSPGYPASAVRDRRQGRVVVLMQVSAEGKVTKAEIHKSSGWPDIDAVALEVAKTWKFTPARRDGKPVAHEYIKPWNFRIEN
jgi:TonB family protein